MQCSQPFCGTGFPNNSHYVPFGTDNYTRQHQMAYPEVIGEGDVVSVVSPDGGVQFYFLPTHRRQTVCNCNPIPPISCPCWNNFEAYFIRSVSNPIPQTGFLNQSLNMFGAHYGPGLVSDSNSPPGFQLKFHNDRWTSTTDLRYFCPRANVLDWFSITPTKASAAVQAETHSYRRSNNAKPCLCSEQRESQSVEMEMVDCFRDKVDNSSRTSVSSHQDKTSETKVSKRKSKMKRHKHRKGQKKPSKVNCECNKPSTTDKSVTTYADKASSCAAERNTQTNHETSSKANSVKSEPYKCDSNTELWLPKTFRSLNELIKDSSEKLIAVSETCSSSESCCCSATDSDRRGK